MPRSISGNHLITPCSRGGPSVISWALLKTTTTAVDALPVTTRAPARVRTAALLLAAASGAGLLAAGPASADPGRTAAQARADAAAAVSAAQAAGSAVARAQDELTRSTAAVGSAVSQSVQAQVEADRSAAQAEREKAAATARVRSLYMDGALGAGTAGARRGLALLSSAVSGGDPAVAERGVRGGPAHRPRAGGAAGGRGVRGPAAGAGRAVGGDRGGVATMRDVAAQVSRADDALRLAQSRVEALQGEAPGCRRRRTRRRRWRRRRRRPRP